MDLGNQKATSHFGGVPLIRDERIGTLYPTNHSPSVSMDPMATPAVLAGFEELLTGRPPVAPAVPALPVAAVLAAVPVAGPLPPVAPAAVPPVAPAAVLPVGLVGPAALAASAPAPVQPAIAAAAESAVPAVPAVPAAPAQPKAQPKAEPKAEPEVEPEVEPETEPAAADSPDSVSAAKAAPQAELAAPADPVAPEPAALRAPPASALPAGWNLLAQSPPGDTRKALVPGEFSVCINRGWNVKANTLSPLVHFWKSPRTILPLMAACEVPSANPQESPARAASQTGPYPLRFL